MCEFCGTKIRSNADKCYVHGCIGYGMSITEFDAERNELIAGLGELYTPFTQQA